MLADPPAIEMDDLPEEVLNAQSLRLAPNDQERLLALLQEEHWNKAAVARRLGLTSRAINYRISKFDTQIP